MKVSVVIPVLNEESGIETVLQSLFLQSYKPSEIVIADGGSTDNTIEVTNSFQGRGIPIKIVSNKERLPGAGRNEAIKNALHDLIACIDAGNVAEPDWLKELAAPIIENNSINVVYGRFLPDATTHFERSVVAIYYSYYASYFYTDTGAGLVDDMESKGIPFTGSSLLFKKSAWEKVGGFPTWLRTAEDKLFGKNLASYGCKLYYNPRAAIRHHIRKNPLQMFRQSLNYARGNGRTRQISSGSYRIVSRYVAGFALLLLSLFYPMLLWLLPFGIGIYVYRSGYKRYKVFYKKSPGLKELVSLPLALFFRDLGLICGIIAGHWDYFMNPVYKKSLDEYRTAKGE
jgi:glycosyltransferase involved in cell wall biosynthesis